MLTTIVRLPRQAWHICPGYLVLFGIFFSLLAAFYPAAIMLAAGLFWLACYKLRAKISSRNAKQSLILVGLGLGLSAIALWQNQSLSLLELLRGNVGIVAMLAGVSFLTVISQPKIGSQESLPMGKRAIISTFLGVHLFGAVINVSSIFIHADRMSTNRPLSPSQLMVLTRGFSTAAFWSPFFAAMAVALSYVPEANLGLLMSIGGAISVVAILITFFEVKATLTKQTFYGYPLRVNSLRLPLILTLLVFALHYLFPDLSILFIITLCAPLLCLLFLMGHTQPKAVIKRHVEGRLANMQNEITLFLSAGVFAFGLQAVMVGQTWFSPFTLFDASAASLCFVLMIVLSMVGFHMLIGIAIIAPIALPLNPDPSLLAFIILASWSIGAAVGPLSGMNISLQGMYGISSQKIMRLNLRYAVLMSLVVIAMTFVLEAWLL